MKVTPGWRTRMFYKLATADDYEVYVSAIVRQYIAGELDADQKDVQLGLAKELWRQSLHFQEKVS